MKFEITEIQLFGNKDRYSANIAINDKFLLQLGIGGEFSIPDSDLACWSGDKNQDYAHDNYKADEIANETNALEAIESAKEIAINWF